MGDVISPEALQRAKSDTSRLVDVEGLTAPTAHELLQLTEQALDEVCGAIPLSLDQHEALLDALQRRLVDVVVRDATGGSDEAR